MIFRGDDMLADEPRKLRFDRLARMIAADNWLHIPPRRRRHLRRALAIVIGGLGLASVSVALWGVAH